MKRILFLLIAAVFVTLIACDVQQRELTSISRDLEDGQVALAKERIDSIIETEARENPNAWLTKANVYMEIALSEDPAISELHPTPLQVADDAIKKAEEIDKDNQFLLHIQQANLFLSQVYYEIGAGKFNEGVFDDASSLFYRSYEISESFGSIDTLTLFYAGYAAKQGELMEDATKYMEKLVELDFHELEVYTTLISAHAGLENYDEAEKWIERAKELDPDEVPIEIIFAEANYYLRIGDAEGAERAISAAIEREPDNANLYFALGANYERIYLDDTHTEEDRDNAFNSAIESYEQSLELEPDQFDVVYSIGALYFNKGIMLYEEADEALREDHDFALYEKRAKEFQSIWLKAQPYLEEAKEMIDEENPNYRVVINSLTELYARTNQTDKLNEIMELRKRKGFETIEED